MTGRVLDRSGARPGLGDCHGIVDAPDLEQSEAAYDLGCLGEGPVGHDRPFRGELDLACGRWPGELLAADDGARRRMLAPPSTDTLARVRHRRRVASRLVGRAHEQHHHLHLRISLCHAECSEWVVTGTTNGHWWNRQTYAARMMASHPDMSAAPDEASRLAVERVFRHESGRVLATLIATLGGDFDTAEEAVQDAFLAAIEHWPREGSPTDLAPGSPPPHAAGPSTACDARGGWWRRRRPCRR